MHIDSNYLIRDLAELGELYGPALERSVLKQIDHLDAYCRDFIAASPMVILGTQFDGAADNSPRGDAPGFVVVADDHTLLIPDRRGNNRLDTLRNIVRNPSIGLLFLIPGVNETFRVNGEAVLSRDPALTEQFTVQGKACGADHSSHHGHDAREAHWRLCGSQGRRRRGAGAGSRYALLSITPAGIC